MRSNVDNEISCFIMLILCMHSKKKQEEESQNRDNKVYPESKAWRKTMPEPIKCLSKQLLKCFIHASKNASGSAL